MNIRNFFLWFQGKKECSNCHHILYIYHFKNKSSICGRCKKRFDRNKIIGLFCPYCFSKSIKLIYESANDHLDNDYICFKCHRQFDGFEIDIAIKKEKKII